MALAAVRSKAVVLLLLTFCLLLLPLWESVIVLCFVVRFFMSILVLQSSWWGRESWLLCLICLPGVLWWLSGSSSRCHEVVCSLWLWYFLIILTYYFCKDFLVRFLIFPLYHPSIFFDVANQNFNYCRSCRNHICLLQCKNAVKRCHCAPHFTDPMVKGRKNTFHSIQIWFSSKSSKSRSPIRYLQIGLKPNW